MCGIFGFVGRQPAEQRKLLMALNYARGKDSTGLAYNMSDTNWAPKYTKIKDDSISCLSGKKFQDQVFTGLMLLGHTRAASGGHGVASPSETTAHPFYYKGVLLAHNGIIYNWAELESRLRKTETDLPNLLVDSQIICARLGVRMPFKEAFSELSGVAATWFIHQDHPRSFFLWSWKKELHYYYRNKGRGQSEFAFSSDDDHLAAVGYPKKKIRKLSDNGTLLKVTVIPEIEIEQIGVFPAKSMADTSRYHGADDDDVPWRSGNRSAYVTAGYTPPTNTSTTPTQTSQAKADDNIRIANTVALLEAILCNEVFICEKERMILLDTDLAVSFDLDNQLVNSNVCPTCRHVPREPTGEEAVKIFTDNFAKLPDDVKSIIQQAYFADGDLIALANRIESMYTKDQSKSTEETVTTETVDSMKGP